MALITCPQCGKSISDSAKACPHCGYVCKKQEQGRSYEALPLTERNALDKEFAAVEQSPCCHSGGVEKLSAQSNSIFIFRFIS